MGKSRHPYLTARRRKKSGEPPTELMWIVATRAPDKKKLRKSFSPEEIEIILRRHKIEQQEQEKPEW